MSLPRPTDLCGELAAWRGSGYDPAVARAARVDYRRIRAASGPGYQRIAPHDLGLNVPRILREHLVSPRLCILELTCEKKNLGGFQLGTHVVRQEVGGTDVLVVVGAGGGLVGQAVHGSVPQTSEPFW